MRFRSHRDNVSQFCGHILRHRRTEQQVAGHKAAHATLRPTYRLATTHYRLATRTGSAVGVAVFLVQGVMAIALGLPPTGIGFPAVFVAIVIGVTELDP